jgi:hypothetical protein
MFNRSNWTISNTISKLKEKGLVKEVLFDGRRRTLEITDFGKITYLLLDKSNMEINKEINKEINTINIVWQGQVLARSKMEPRHWAIEYWNELEQPEKLPKHNNPTTKSYKQASNYLDRIHHGILLNNRPAWTRNLVEFFKARSIPVALLQQPWSREDILKGLLRLSHVYYLDTPRMSLVQMIYNPYTKYDYYSYFFDSFYNYRLLKWRIDNRETEPMEKYVIYLKKTKEQLMEEGWSAPEINEMLERQKLLDSKGLN